jgi:hypothetical protein
MKQLFISYSSKTRLQVQALADDLQLLGYRVWFDQDLVGGQKWWDAILEQIRQCDGVIFALTPESLASKPCELEYTYAHALNKPILPVLMGEGVNVSVLNPILQERQFINYQNPDKATLGALSKALALLPVTHIPNPLPDAPPIPLSPLVDIRQRIEASTLPQDEQDRLYLDLKRLLQNPTEQEGARILLKQLQNHPSLLANTYRDIQELLNANPTVRMKPIQAPPMANTPQTDKPLTATEQDKFSLLNDMIPPDSPDLAVLHIRRVWGTSWWLRAFAVYLNGVKIGEVRNNSTAHFTNIKAGKYDLQLRVDASVTHTRTFEVKAGEHIFFKTAPALLGIIDKMKLDQLTLEEYIDLQTS